MPHLRIFTDGSVNAQLKVGYGASLLVSDLRVPVYTMKSLIQVKCFEQTSSTKLELQTILWSLDELISLVNRSDIFITIYTDSQNIISLQKRRARLEQNHYFSNKKNKRLSHYQLYQDFYRLTSILNCKFIKIEGHKSYGLKDKTDRLFSLVDQASRCALRRTIMNHDAISPLKVMSDDMRDKKTIEDKNVTRNPENSSLLIT